MMTRSVVIAVTLVGTLSCLASAQDKAPVLDKVLDKPKVEAPPAAPAPDKPVVDKGPAKAAAKAAAQEKPLPDATWQAMRVEIAEQQAREAVLARIQSDYKAMHPDVVAGARALEAQIEAAAKNAGVDTKKCYPDAKNRRWVPRAPGDVCAKP